MIGTNEPQHLVPSFIQCIANGFRSVVPESSRHAIRRCQPLFGQLQMLQLFREILHLTRRMRHLHGDVVELMLHPVDGFQEIFPDSFVDIRPSHRGDEILCSGRHGRFRRKKSTLSSVRNFLCCLPAQPARPLGLGAHMPSSCPFYSYTNFPGQKSGKGPFRDNDDMTAITPGSSAYWDDRYATIGSTQVSWYQESPGVSAAAIAELALPESARIVDVGGGASSLIDTLFADGFTDITVVDLSAQALATAQQRLGSTPVTWVCSDIRSWEPPSNIDLWHDRAAFHFLIDPDDQQRYWDTVRAHLSPGGYVIVGTFAADGPEKCSGLPVQRYTPEELLARMGPGFIHRQLQREVHHTPSGGEQPFTWVVAQRS
jgi:2-polyprenyl-3-methyl-5-hydroxy-6-metoxy-1,4-benzoquinol methylase